MYSSLGWCSMSQCQAVCPQMHVSKVGFKCKVQKRSFLETKKLVESIGEETQQMTLQFLYGLSV
jgi:hypothetical protein